MWLTLRRMWHGRHHCGDNAFPRVKGVYLVECGTHAVTDAGFWPCHVSERHGRKRTVGKGLHGFEDTGDRKGRPYLILKVYGLEIASLLI